MTPRHAVTAVALAAAAVFAGAGWAQAPDGQRESVRPMRGFERLHNQLNLNPQQEDLWEKAKIAQRDAFKAMRAQGAETRAKLRAEIDKPGADLKQFVELRDQLREQMHAQIESSRKQVRAAWFGLYDSLDASQREQVRVAIRDGMDRMGHRGGRRGAPRGETQGQG
jgi:hypothetical protein